MRKCKSCGVEKDETLFDNNGVVRRDGTLQLLGKCRACVSAERKAKYRLEHPVRLQKTQVEKTDAKKAYDQARREIANEQRRARGPETKQRRAAEHRRSLYGLSEIEYDTMLEAQHWLCACCHSPLKPGLSTHIDHNHETGQVRGILCHHCNTGLGLFRHDTEQLQLAIQYMRRFAHQVLGKKASKQP